MNLAWPSKFPGTRFGPSARARVLAGLVAPALCAATGLVQAQLTGQAGAGRAVVVAPISSASRVVAKVYEGLFSDVTLERAEAGAAPNLHPATIEAGALRAAFASIQLGEKALFNDDELTEIVPPLVTALARATAEQDVCFAVSGKHTAFGPLVPRATTTGRIFRTADGLQVIIGLAQKPFESEFRATGYLIAFEPGRRASPVDKSVSIGVAGLPSASRRADWVSLNPSLAAPSAVSAPAAVPAPPPGPAPATAMPAGSQVPKLAPDADAIYRDVSERLKALQRLRDSGAITPQEYEEKRKQILRDF